MPSIELGQTTPIAAIDSPTTRVWTDLSGANTTSAAAQPAAAAAQTVKPAVETSVTTDAGTAPVDVDRVQLIRHAVQNGTYPILPARIADAMIAAGMLLRNGSKDEGSASAV